MKSSALQEDMVVRKEYDQPELIDVFEDIVSPVISDLTIELICNDVTLDNYVDYRLIPGRALMTVHRQSVQSIFSILFRQAIRHGGAGTTIGFDLQLTAGDYFFTFFGLSRDKAERTSFRGGMPGNFPCRDLAQYLIRLNGGYVVAISCWPEDFEFSFALPAVRV